MRAEKQYTESKTFVELPNAEKVTVQFTKQTPTYNEQTHTIEMVQEHQEVEISGQQIDDVSKDKYGMSKTDLLNAINSVDIAKHHLLGMVTVRAKNSLKRVFNPFSQ